MRSLIRKAYARVPFKRQAYHLLRGMKLPERVYRHLHFRGPITVDIGEGRSFRTHHYGYQVENDLFWAGFGNGWEATSLRLWARLARRSSVILDVGANTGIYALSAKAANPAARVYAFEPATRIHERLSRNIALNSYDIVPVMAGLSNRTGEATFYDTMSDHAYSASLDPDMLAGHPNRVRTTVAIARADDFVAKHGLGSIDLAKIDTERHEREVLEGFGSLIRSARPSFLIEILDRSLGSEVARMLGQDYAFFEIVEGVGVRRVDELGLGPRNHLVCPAAVAQEVGLGDGVAHASL